MKNQWRVILGLVLVLIVVIFAVLNNQAVPVNFGFTKISGPLILIILGSAIIGALVGLLTSTTTIWNQRKELKAVQKELDIYKNDMPKYEGTIKKIIIICRICDEKLNSIFEGIDIFNKILVIKIVSLVS